MKVNGFNCLIIRGNNVRCYLIRKWGVRDGKFLILYVIDIVGYLFRMVVV